MGLLNTITRGGQLSMHTYQMIKQVSLVILLLSFFTGLGTFTHGFFKETAPYERYLYGQYLLAEFKTTVSLRNTSLIKQPFRYPNGDQRLVRSLDLLHNPSIKNLVQDVEQRCMDLLWDALCHGLLAMVLLTGFFAYNGHGKSQKVLERGNRIMNAKHLTAHIKKRKVASDLTLDGLPLIKGKETAHMLVTGTTGAGKSNCLNTLIPQIRARGDRAIIVDLTGEGVARHYQNTDLILNPLDPSSQHWLPWAECQADSHYDQLAATMVPKTHLNDAFWESAGKSLLSVALRKTHNQQDIQHLYRLLVEEDLRHFSQFFQGTAAAAYTHMEGEKMTLSIRATLANQLQCLKLLKQTTDPFSVRDWVINTSHQNWLFLTAAPDQRETLRPLLSTWMDIATNTLMSTPPNKGPRLWFIMDELPALQRLPSLEMAMAESRKYGGCILAGVQSFPQLSALYGPRKAQALLDLFNTKIFFRNTDPDTNAWIARVLGEAETTEPRENLSYGAHTVRDGISLSRHTQTKPLVMPTEIANLKDLEAFIKLPGDLPIARMNMTYKGS